MKKFIGVTIAFISLTAFVGCDPTTEDNQQQTPGMEIRSSEPHITSPQISTEDLSKQIEGNRVFAVDMYQKLAKINNDNLFFSPHSIEVALAMTWAGARKETESAIADTLQFRLDQEFLHPVFNYLNLELNSRGEGAQGADGKGFRLNVCNAIWGQMNFAFQDPFLDVLARHYDAGLRVLDFKTDPVGAAQHINSWVEDATENRIQNLIQPGTLNANTRMVLVNAIYFNASWANPFSEVFTKNDTFHKLDNQNVDVPMMYKELYTNYIEGDDYLGVELNYDGDELSMLILVPDSGEFSIVEQHLDADFLFRAESSKKHGLVNLTLPSWEIDGTTISLAKIFKNSGMGIAFNSTNADFSGISDQSNLYIQDILHQAFVKVNEAGTEAAAATAIGMGTGSSIQPEPVRIKIDRPFIFLIKDKPTGQILFVGRVTDPS